MPCEEPPGGFLREWRADLTLAAGSICNLLQWHSRSGQTKRTGAQSPRVSFTSYTSVSLSVTC